MRRGRGGRGIKAAPPETLLNEGGLARPVAKSKRDEDADAKEGDYEFVLPSFDERAFIRREVQSARASFITLGLGVLAGILATVTQRVAGQAHWGYGWIAILLSIVALRPLLTAMSFPEDVTKPRALLGSYSMLFFTGLAVWVLGVNVA